MLVIIINHNNLIELTEYVSVDENTAYGQLAIQSTIHNQKHDQVSAVPNVMMTGEMTSATGCAPVIYEELV